MKTFNDKEFVDYVYCSNCHLNYHIDCSGIDLQNEKKNDFICDKCKVLNILFLFSYTLLYNNNYIILYIWIVLFF